MRRRNLLTLMGSALVASPPGAFAQTPPKIYGVGVISSGPPYTLKSPIGAALPRVLAQAGFTLGQNLNIEFRGAGGHDEKLPQLITELVASKVDVIVTRGYPAALAAKQGTSLPVVSLDSGDPVGTGLVASLARPGGNLTGISDVSAELTPKRMELLKEFAPSLQRIAILWDADNLGMTLRYKAAEAGAQALGVKVQPLGVREPNDFSHAFAAMNSEMPDAILMVTDFLTILDRKPVFEFAAAHRLPAIYEFAFFVHDGGLMSYGPNEDESFSRVAAIVARILKGAQPAELPFEQPTKFELAINRTTANSLGITVPPILLAQADEIVE